jgi:small subunit ribosomal protein S21
MHSQSYSKARLTQVARRYGLAEVRIFEGESIESALRRFKRQVQQEGIIKEAKKHAFYLKPGEKKRIKSALAQKLKRKKVRRQPTETDPKTKSRSDY